MKQQSDAATITIIEPTTGFFKDRGSKFISHLYPIQSITEFKELLNNLKHTYTDAQHICWAVRLGKEQYCSDDGEPAHSAGAPILRQLLSQEINRAALFVVRYFGGTKLGISGLINAYSTAAADAIAKAERIEWVDKVRIIIIFDYEYTSAVEKGLKWFKAQVLSAEYFDRCKFIVEIKRDQSDALAHHLKACSESILFHHTD